MTLLGAWRVTATLVEGEARGVRSWMVAAFSAQEACFRAGLRMQADTFDEHRKKIEVIDVRVDKVERKTYDIDR